MKQQHSLLPYKQCRPDIHPSAFVADTARVVGDVQVGEASGIWFGCVLRGDVNLIRIGARTNIQDGTVIHVTGEGRATYVGDEVTVGHMALLHACTLESGSFVGMRATVLDGAVIEQGAMVAAGALVTPNKRIPSGQLWAGAPARYMRDLTPEELASFADSAHRYAGLAAEYRQRLGTG